jgi:hypothetical protein
MTNVMGAAKHVFPTRLPEIEQLASRNEGFYDLCQDFGIALELSHSWDLSTAPERDRRLAEFNLLADELAKEIKDALDAAVILPFTKPKSSELI